MHENETVNGIEFDPNGRAILAEYEDENERWNNAVLFDSKLHCYISAICYDKATGDCANAVATDDLTWASMRANPGKLEDAAIVWNVGDFEVFVDAALKEAGLDRNDLDSKTNDYEALVDHVRADVDDMRVWREEAEADGLGMIMREANREVQAYKKRRDEALGTSADESSPEFRASMAKRISCGSARYIAPSGSARLRAACARNPQGVHRIIRD